MQTLDINPEKRYFHFFNKKIKHYTPDMKIEACYQEIQNSKDISNLLLQEERMYHFYLGMINATKKIGSPTKEQMFLFKYAYLKCLIIKLRLNHSLSVLNLVLESSTEDHLKLKFKELNYLWKNLSPLLNLLYEDNVKEILSECVEYNKILRA